MLPDPTPAEVDALLALPHVGRAVLDVAAMARRDGVLIEARGTALYSELDQKAMAYYGPSDTAVLLKELASMPYTGYHGLDAFLEWAREVAQ